MLYNIFLYNRREGLLEEILYPEGRPDQREKRRDDELDKRGREGGASFRSIAKEDKIVKKQFERDENNQLKLITKDSSPVITEVEQPVEEEASAVVPPISRTFKSWQPKKSISSYQDKDSYNRNNNNNRDNDNSRYSGTTKYSSDYSGNSYEIRSSAWDNNSPTTSSLSSDKDFDR